MNKSETVAELIEINEEVVVELKRSWFCKCGYTFDEETGGGEYQGYQEGNEGTSTRFCSGCNARTQMEWRVIENTDPDDELDEESGFCGYCQEFKPVDIMNYDFENFSHPVCDYCLENKSEHDADMDAQDSKWGKNKV